MPEVEYWPSVVVDLAASSVPWKYAMVKSLVIPLATITEAAPAGVTFTILLLLAT